ncbi:hypothetical protein BKA56DRAFT_614491 [Ilyonectria sp. MPI-CAGE-AT-0026]|nr:hypothetical protein BKA56DRAFT_614491 [Ilyonectria sp. MPI-CAGE-AT-0026]
MHLQLTDGFKAFCVATNNELAIHTLPAGGTPYIHGSGPGPTPTLPAGAWCGGFLAVQPMPWFGEVRRSAEGERRRMCVCVSIQPGQDVSRFGFQGLGAARRPGRDAVTYPVRLCVRTASHLDNGDQARRRGSVAVCPGIKGPRPGQSSSERKKPSPASLCCSMHRRTTPPPPPTTGAPTAATIMANFPQLAKVPPPWHARHSPPKRSFFHAVSVLREPAFFLGPFLGGRALCRPLQNRLLYGTDLRH